MSHFPVKFTASVRQQLDNPAIARQFIEITPSSVAAEQPGADAEPFSYDAVADQQYRVGRGMIRKYQNRLLLIAHGQCAVNCRYCFRQHFDYAGDTLQEADLPQLYDYLLAHPEIDEVILSGGDPLMLSNQRLTAIFTVLSQSASVRRIRIHSRVVTVLSRRINDRFLAMCEPLRTKLVIVTHINHADEIDHPAEVAIQRLRSLGILLLNQSVLLRGVNDDVAILKQLSDRLFAVGILPYYLNLLDRVKGAESFYITDDEARALYQALAKCSSGYLLPKLVRDDGGSAYKCIIGLE